jgi:hypothetical protein
MVATYLSASAGLCLSSAMSLSRSDGSRRAEARGFKLATLKSADSLCPRGFSSPDWFGSNGRDGLARLSDRISRRFYIVPASSTATHARSNRVLPKRNHHARSRAPETLPGRSLNRTAGAIQSRKSKLKAKRQAGDYVP